MSSPAAKQSVTKEADLVGKVVKGPAAQKRAPQRKAKQAGSLEISSSKIKGKALPDKRNESKSRWSSQKGYGSVFKAAGGAKIRDFRGLYLSSPEDRIKIIRAGVGATESKAFAVDLGIPQERFFRMFGIAQATVSRRASKNQPMSTEESEKIVGMLKLVGQVQTILDQSGDRELMKDFDAAKWTAQWIEESIPALGGRRPADYMDTIEGQEMVSRLLSMMQTGAYA